MPASKHFNITFRNGKIRTRCFFIQKISLRQTANRIDDHVDDRIEPRNEKDHTKDRSDDTQADTHEKSDDRPFAGCLCPRRIFRFIDYIQNESCQRHEKTQYAKPDVRLIIRRSATSRRTIPLVHPTTAMTAKDRIVRYPTAAILTVHDPTLL